jgi:hypothetical protein
LKLRIWAFWTTWVDDVVPGTDEAAGALVIAEIVVETAELGGREPLGTDCTWSGSSDVVEEAFTDDGFTPSGVVAWELVDLESALVVTEVVRAKFEVLAEGEWLLRPISEIAVVMPDTWEGPGFDIGWLTLVDRYIMSLPWTTRLSLDFLRSNVSISKR